MTAEAEPQLAPWAEELLEHERPVPTLDADAVARLRARIDGEIDGSGSDGGGSAPTSTGVPTPSPTTGLHIGSVLLGLGAGLALGIVGTVLLQPEGAERTQVAAETMAPAMVVSSPEPSEHTASATEAEHPVGAEPAAVDPPPREVVARDTSSAPRPLSTLARERRLLDAARGAIRVNDIAGALSTLERHRSRFPSGVLAEEREALHIRALLAGGRLADARLRLQGFRDQYPQSLSLPALEARAAQAAP